MDSTLASFGQPVRPTQPPATTVPRSESSQRQPRVNAESIARRGGATDECEDDVALSDDGGDEPEDDTKAADDDRRAHISRVQPQQQQRREEAVGVTEVRERLGALL